MAKLLATLLAGIFLLLSPRPPAKTPVPASTATFVYPITGYRARLQFRDFGKLVTPAQAKQLPCGFPFSGYHTGDDLEITPEEQNQEIPVYAVTSGQIISAGNVSGYGGLIVMRWPGYTAYYGHISLPSLGVSGGQEVTAGQKLAVLGNACSAQTDFERKHLHFAIHKGDTIDVRGYVQDTSELNAWENPNLFLVREEAKEP
jgi:murein DD-endopeptidase MepM/ murein hydrolase activator NlpD